jgi:hypothetical protein
MFEVQHTTTRQYAAGTRLAVATASSAATALPVLGATREVRVLANTRCWLRFGTGGVAASVAATSIPFPADAPEVVIVPADATHFAVIRDTADGFVTLTPVA